MQQIHKASIHKQHSSTDLICLYVFLFLQGLVIVIAFYAFFFGQPGKLALPYDPDHRVCGVDLEGYPYIYFVTPQSSYLHRTVCVKQCPTAESEKLECHTNSVVKSCQVNPSVDDLSKSVLLYNTISYKGYLCLPTTEYYYAVLQEHLYPGRNQIIARNVYDSELTILLAFILSLIISVLILIFVEKYAKLMIWIFLGLISLLLAFGGVLAFMIYLLASNPPKLNGNQVNQLSEATLQTSADSTFLKSSEYLWLSILLFTVSFLTVIIAAFSKERVNQTIAFIKVGGDFIKCNMKIVGVPLLFFVVTTLYSIAWVEYTMQSISVYARHLYSATTVTNKPNSLPFDQARLSGFVQIVCGLNVFIFLWNLAFLIGCCDFIITGAVCEWYYSQGDYKKQDEIDPIMLPTQRTLQHHLGSVALGSFLITLFAIPKFLADLVFSSTKGASCAAAQERMVLSFTKYGYVISNLRNEHYIQSSLFAKQLLLQDFQTSVILGGLGETFILIGRSFVSVFCAVISYCFLWHLPYGYVVSLLILCLSFTVSSLFMSVYGLSSEAIYLLYLQSKIQDPEDRPQCSVTLKQILDQITAEQLVYAPA